MRKKLPGGCHFDDSLSHVQIHYYSSRQVRKGPQVFFYQIEFCIKAKRNSSGTKRRKKPLQKILSQSRNMGVRKFTG